MAKTFQIFRSSAGSGKTRTLAREYLKLALQYRSYYFKHILAVTFTNKSTQEMKDRIMWYLDDFANGRDNELAGELRSEMKLSSSEFKERALEVQSAVLHDYGNFSISTIDAFFQKIIRSFTYEAGIAGDYRLEVDHKLVLEEVIANLVDELGNNSSLTKWVVDLALENLSEDKPWDMRQSLMEFSGELFKEDFKKIEDEIVSIAKRDQLNSTLKLLQSKKWEFVNGLRARANSLLEDIHAHHFSVDDFNSMSKGIYGFILKVSKLQAVSLEISKSAENSLVADAWTKKTHPQRKEIIRLAEERWIKQLQDIIDFRNRNYEVTRSAEEALKNFYSFGLITDISRKLIEYKKENNLMLLSDAPQFLNKIINDSDTPFIYEKAGSVYRNFLIDEFQDTSYLQWRNFLPLLVNNLDSGHPSLVVGDVKQSIYRWRGGDKNLLQSQVTDAIGKSRTETKLLNNNFRSTSTIVKFNNELFKSAAISISLETEASVSSKEYGDVKQEIIKKQEGFVHAQFFEDKDWRQNALIATTRYIEELQQKGAAPGEIAILVRKKEDGKQIISHLLEHKESAPSIGVTYDVVSSESLLIGGAAVVNLLVAAMKYLHNTDNDIARAQLAFEQARFQNRDVNWSDVFGKINPTVFEQTLPINFAKNKIQLRKLPLFELVETLVGLFNIKETEELPYLLGFQDSVLEFVTRERNDLGAFLEWWEIQKDEKAIVAPSGSSAMQLMTIHKAKGLQFKYVIIPFCFWQLDHENFKRPNLWVKSDQSFLKEVGYVPVKYSSGLKETFFKEKYVQERSDIFLDNLNLLYVAFTRPEIGLIFFGPAGLNQTSSQLVFRCLETSMSENWNPSTLEWKSGEVQIVADKEKAEQKESSKLNSYPVYSWRDKLVIKKSLWVERKEVDDQHRKRLQGIYIHAALSSVRYVQDIPMALQRLVDNGTITSDEKIHMEETLAQWMKNPQIEEWFSPRWQVQTELNVLLPKGESVRIDRVLIKEKMVRVIDYKTGSPKSEDQVQVVTYCNLMREMGYDAEGFLFYLKDGEVVQVGKKKQSRKKPENQLGLDF